MVGSLRHDLPFHLGPRCASGSFALLTSFPVIGFAPQKVARARSTTAAMKMAPDDAAWRRSSRAVFFWRALSFFDARWRRLALCGAFSDECAIARQRVSRKRQPETVDDN